MLFSVPSYSEVKQTEIILACAALHNFIIDNGEEEEDEVDLNEEERYVLEEEGGGAEEDVNMNGLRDEIANECFQLWSQNR